jgi:hypothetical protein
VVSTTLGVAGWGEQRGHPLPWQRGGGLLGRGRIAEAATLIDPLTNGPVERDHWALHEERAEIDMLRGEPDAAAQRVRQIKTHSPSRYRGSPRPSARSG